MKTNPVSLAIGEAMRPEAVRLAGAEKRAADAPVSKTSDGPYKPDATGSIAGSLGKAIEAKQRDNLVLGETLISFGLLQRHELSAVKHAQATNDDVVGSLTVASAIRTRLGDILLHAKHITSQQLEHALELQRQGSGLLGEILVGLGALDRGTLDAALALQAQRKPDA